MEVLVPLDKIEEILNCLQQLKHEGLVGMIGIGGNPPVELFPYITKENFDVVTGYCKMDACNLSVFERENIYYFAASALHFALLGNRYQQYLSEAPSGELGKYITLQDISKAKIINAIAHRNGLNLASLSQRYLFSIAEASRIVMGARNIKQITNTIKDWREGALDQDLFNEITTAILNE